MTERFDNVQKLAQVKQALKDRQIATARELLLQILRTDPDNVEAWFISSYVTNDRARQIESLERALRIDQNYAPARTRLEKLRPTAVDLDQLRNSSAPAPATKPEGIPILPIPETLSRPRSRKLWILAGGIVAAVIIAFRLLTPSTPQPTVIVVAPTQAAGLPTSAIPTSIPADVEQAISQRLTQTAEAITVRNATQTIDALFQNAQAATASFQGTVDARFDQLMTTTAMAPIMATAYAISTLEAPTLTAYNGQLQRARAAIDGTSPLLTAGNASQVIQLAQIQFPTWFNATFKGGRLLVMGKTNLFSARLMVGDAEIGDPLSDQPVMQFTFQDPVIAYIGDSYANQAAQTVISVAPVAIFTLDPATHKVRFTMQDEGSITAVSDDASLVVKASDDSSQVRIWDTSTGRVSRTVELGYARGANGPYSLSISQDNSKLLATACDGSVLVVNLSDDKIDALQPGSRGVDYLCSRAIGFTPDGSYSLTAGTSGIYAFLSKHPNQSPVHTFSDVKIDSASQVTTSPDGALIAAMDKTAFVIWNFKTGEVLKRQEFGEGDIDRVQGIMFTADRRYLVAGTEGRLNGLTWWGLPQQTPATLQAKLDTATQVASTLTAALKDSAPIIYARRSADQQLSLFSRSADGSSETILLDSLPFSYPPETTAYRISADGRVVAVNSNDGVKIFLRNPDDPGALNEHLTIAPAAGGNLLLSPDGHYLLYSVMNGNFQDCALWDIQKNQAVRLSETLECTYMRASWSPDSRSIVMEQIYRTDNTHTRSRILVLSFGLLGAVNREQIGDSQQFVDPIFLPDGTLQLTAYSQERNRQMVVQMRSGKSPALMMAYPPGQFAYRQATWSPDGKLLAVVEDSKQIVIFDHAGNIITTMPEDDQLPFVSSIQWSPDSRFLSADRASQDAAQEKIYLYSADGSRIIPFADGRYAQWVS